MDNLSAQAADRTDPRPFQPTEGGMSRTAMTVIAVLVVAALAAGGWYWWQQRAPAPPAPVAAPAVQEAPVAAPPAEPVIRHPIETMVEPSAPALPPLDQANAVITRALVELLGAKPVAAMLQTDDFVRRVVATVDNLGRTHAAPRLWPVAPTPGRFTVQRAGDADVMPRANAARYNAFATFAGSIDSARAAAMYKAHYPLFQSAYQELGYPRAYFNDRLVEVIDQLLATPEPNAPIALRLTEVKGDVASDRPWVRYEFADPALQALPAGQKMLLRMGPEHAHRLKAQLKAFRRAITQR